MNLPVPSGYTLYGGADFSSAVDAAGNIFYSSSARFPDGRFGQIVVKVSDGVASIVDLPEFVSGRGQLDYTPAGLYLSVWHQIDGRADKSVPKIFKIEQFVNFANTGAGCNHVAYPVPAARWITPDENDWTVTDELIRDKFYLTDTLLNAIREALIKNGLAE